MVLAGRERVEVQSPLGEKAIAQGLPVCRVPCFLLQPKASDIPGHSTPEIISDLLWDHSNQDMDYFWMLGGCITPTCWAGLPSTSILCIGTFATAQKERPKKMRQSSLQPPAVSAHKLRQLSYGNYITWDLFNISIREKEPGSLAVTSNQRVLSWWAAPHHWESSRNLRWIGFK